MIGGFKEEAAKKALADIRFLLSVSPEPDSSDNAATYLDGAIVVELLEKNFDRLDRDGNGISRSELMAALSSPGSFDNDEYEMLRLLACYFDTIINLSDDEDGEELRISRQDLEQLEQFLVQNRMTMEELHRWCRRDLTLAEEVGPPPMSG